MSVTSTDDVVLAVEDLGGSGPPLLLSHATGFHGHVLAPLAAHLVDRFHCWTFDYRGHGGSGRPANDDVRWSSYAEDSRAVVHALGLGGGIAFGHSMGGTTLVMNELAEPGTFQGLVLYEPVIFPPDFATGSPRPDLAGSARRRRPVFASRQEAYANFAAKPPLDVLHPDALAAYVERGFLDTADGRVRLACDPEHEARTYEAGAQHATFSRLGDLACPVLVLAGRAKGNPPAIVAEQVAERVRHGRLERLDELGHFGPMQAPALVADRIRRFVDEIG